MRNGVRQRRFVLTLLMLSALCAVCVAAVAAANPPKLKINPIFTYNKPDREQHLYACAKREGELTLYTPSTATDATIRPAFEKSYPGVNLKTYVNSSTLSTKLREEEDAGRHVFDVFDSTLGDLSRNDKYFQPFWSPAMKNVRPGLSSSYMIASNGYITGLGVYYNPNLVSSVDVPKTWKDMLNPKYKGKLYIGTDLTIPPAVGTLGAIYGKAWYVGLSKQVRVVNASGRGVVDQVIAGTIPMAIFASSSYYKRDYLDKGAPLRLQVMSPAFAHFQASSISKFTKRPCAAMLFVDWYVSRKSNGAQPVFASLGNALPYPGATTLPFPIAGQLPQTKWKLYFQTSKELYAKLGFKNWTQTYRYYNIQFQKYFILGG